MRCVVPVCMRCVSEADFVALQVFRPRLRRVSLPRRSLSIYVTHTQRSVV